MIQINNKEINYQPAFYAYAQDDSLNPTGLGSAGIYFEYEDLQVYIGIKNDVIDVISNKNSNFFVNLEASTVEKSEKLNKDSKFGDGVVKKYYLNQIEIELDEALFRYYVYNKNKQAYADLFPQAVMKEQTTSGAMIRVEIPWSLGTDALFIGYICMKDKEMLVLDKAIVNESTLKDEVRYAMWKIKSNIVPHTLKRSCNTMAFERTYTYQTDGYMDYFNNQTKLLKETNASRDEMSFVKEKELPNLHLSVFSPLSTPRKPAYENLEDDVFVSHSTVLAPGMVNGDNMVNFGLKEARKGYFELQKDKTWLNIGYKTDDIIYSDSFYICTKPFKTVEPLSKFNFIKRTNVEFGSLIPELAAHKIQPYEDLYAKLKGHIYETLPQTKAQAETELIEIIKEADIPQIVKDYSIPRVNVDLSVVYHQMFYPVKAGPKTTMIVVHPFYDNAFAVHLYDNNAKQYINGVFTSSISSHSFGIRDNKFIFKGIEKEFRKDLNYTLYNGNILYEDLILQHSKKAFEQVTRDTLKILEDGFGSYGFVFIIPTAILAEDMGLNRSNNDLYPFGEQITYVKVKND